MIEIKETPTETMYSLFVDDVVVFESLDIAKVLQIRSVVEAVERIKAKNFPCQKEESKPVDIFNTVGIVDNNHRCGIVAFIPKSHVESIVSALNIHFKNCVNDGLPPNFKRDS